MCGGGSNTGFAAPALAVSGFALTPPLPFWADKALFPALAGALVAAFCMLSGA